MKQKSSSFKQRLRGEGRGNCSFCKPDRVTSARLEALYDAKLLQDDEMHIIEDKVADDRAAEPTILHEKCYKW